MEAVLDVYARPYDPKRPVVCLDESPKQLVSEKRKSYQDSEGVKRVDFEYIREGSADMYMVCEPLGAYREVHIEDNHNRLTWSKIIAHTLENVYPDAEKVSVVQDNLSAHKPAALYEIFEPERARNILKRIEFVHTPKHGSWLNIAEIELSILCRQGIKHRIASKEELRATVKAWYERRNQDQKGVDWQFTTADARVKLKKLYPSVIGC